MIYVTLSLLMFTLHSSPMISNFSLTKYPFLLSFCLTMCIHHFFKIPWTVYSLGLNCGSSPSLYLNVLFFLFPILNLLNLVSILLALLTFLKLSLVQTWALSSTTNSHFHVIYSLQLRRPTNSLLLCLAASYQKTHSFSKCFYFLCPPNSGVCIPIWSPHSTKDIDALERVQRRFTKSFSNIRSLPYSTRLTRLDLQPLYVRRNHLDLITCFRLIHGLTHLDYTSFFSPRLNSVTRGHPYTLIKPPVRLNTSKFSFFSRTVDPWNNLPLSTITASSLPTFKFKLKYPPVS